MSHPRLDIAVWDYDRVAPLRNGRVAIEGVDAIFHSGRIVVDIFNAMVVHRAYDVAELGFTYFLRTLEVDDPPFLLMPIFPVRSFRHSAIYIHKASGIHTPQDLAGKRIGELALYGHDAGVMSKGILSDEFGVKPERSSWIIGGIDFPMGSVDFVSHPVPGGVDVEWAPDGADLGAMLERGEIDALIAADVPRCVLQGSPKVARLFEDYVMIEQDYFRRTNIFPIMHAVAVKRELATDRPDVMAAVYKGFCEAKDATMATFSKGMTFNNMTVMVPWLTSLIDANRELLGEDWWPYGIARNRAAIDAVLRYHYEQGLTQKRFAIEDVFVPGLLDT